MPPLSVEAVHRLGALSESAAAEIHRVTQGNPFFVSEVLASGQAGVPVTVRDAVLARVGATPPPVAALLARLSVVPTRAERWLAESLARGDPDVLVLAERSGMLTGGPDSVAFRHELARQAIESALTAGERLRHNDEVVEALLGHDVHDPARLVHHAERSGRVDVLRVQGPPAAAEAARLGAHRQAAEVLRVLLEQVPDLAPREAADLWTRRAYSLYVVNQYEAALACAASAVTAAEQASDPSRIGDALLVLARVAYFARGVGPASDAAERAVRTLEGVDDPARLAVALTELARAHSNLANVSVVAEPGAHVERHAARATMIAQDLDRADIMAAALCYLGDAKLASGRTAGRDDLDRAIALAGADSRIETRVRCYVNAAGGAFRAGRFGEAETYVAEGLRLAADGEFFAGQYRLRLTRAGVDASRGDWDGAVTELRSLLGSPGEPGIMAPLAASILARLLARRGDEEAREILDGAQRLPHLCADPNVSGRLAVASVELGWLDGSLGDLTADVQRALDVAEAAGTVVIHAELAAYLRRAGIDVAGPARPPGPWAPTLAGDCPSAAAAWTSLGEVYEASVVRATADDPVMRREGLRSLARLGATATLAAV
jgi:tetratricopeptide (TPR) repeat protein